MPTNDFIGFASSGSANIMSQADFAAAAEQGIGMQPGPASSKLANKVLRQGANMAAAIGEVLVDQGENALDNGDISSLKNALLSTLVNNVEKVVDLDFSNPFYIYYKSGLLICFGYLGAPTVGANIINLPRAYVSGSYVIFLTRASGGTTTTVVDSAWTRSTTTTSFDLYVPTYTGYYWLTIGKGA